MVTDPPWPNTPAGLFPAMGTRTAAELVRQAFEILRPERAIIILGCESDPRWLSDVVPASLRWVRSMRLRFNVPSRRGTILCDALIAYAFGDVRPVRPRRVLPGEVTCSESHPRRAETSHPCPLRITHALWLVDHFTRPDDVVVDPFCGSGVIPAAAERMGRSWAAAEGDRTWAAEAQARVDAERAHCSLRLQRVGQGALFADRKAV
jgi:hypothetical protein